MKKTIQINLGQRLIIIDEDAYQALKKYLDSLQYHFRNEEGKDEIMEDIESRIGDLLVEKVGNHKASANVNDVDEVILIMGQPSDFDENTGHAEQSQDASQNKSKSNNGEETRKLYRIKQGSILGGVCTGLADYFDIDVSIVRIIIILLTIGGFGLAIPAYILMWIFLPVGYEHNLYQTKKLYRDPNDKILGGVLSGLSYYFKIPVKSLRIWYGLPFVIFFLGLITGPFNLFFVPAFMSSIVAALTVIYIVLWATIPEAHTPIEKMQMKGEPINLKSIANSIKSDVRDFGNKAQNWVGDQSQKLQGKMSNMDTTEAQKSVRHILRIILKVLGILSMLFIAALLIGLFVIFLASGLSLSMFKTFLFQNQFDLWLFNTILIILIISPILTIIYLFLRRAIQGNKVKPLGYMISAIWMLSLVGILYLGVRLLSDMRLRTYQSSHQVVHTTSDLLHINLYSPEFDNTEYSLGLQEYIYQVDNSLHFLDIRHIYEEKSPDNDFHLIVDKYTSGNNRKENNRRIENIETYIKQSGDTLQIDPYISISKPEVYRGQHVRVIIQIPSGKTVNVTKQRFNKKGTIEYSIGDEEQNIEVI